MSSINTNLSAMSALQNLSSTQNALHKTQNQITSGFKVGEASDNASYWSIATKMKSDVTSLGAVGDAIGQSKAMIDTFASGMNKSLEYLNKMKTAVITAMQPGSDLEALQTEFDANISGLKSTASSASFNGQNWLAGTAETVSLVTSYDGNAKTVGKLDFDTTDTVLFADTDAGTGGLLGDAAAVDLTSSTDLDADLTAIDAAITAVTTAAAKLGANKALLETQESFVGVLSDSLKGGVSTFVDADMNEASTRLQALQTKQQLGVQSLSIANQNSQMILQLFQ